MSLTAQCDKCKGRITSNEYVFINDLFIVDLARHILDDSGIKPSPHATLDAKYMLCTKCLKLIKRIIVEDLTFASVHSTIDKPPTINYEVTPNNAI